eukprot:11218504-Lingulodinium_polyedra.AAC.1
MASRFGGGSWISSFGLSPLPIRLPSTPPASKRSLPAMTSWRALPRGRDLLTPRIRSSTSGRW